MSIWFRPYTLAELDGLSKDSMVEYLDIRFTEIGPDYIRASMPADKRTWQPYGLLHGGASVTLAETLGSTGANCVVDHIGARSQVWEIRIEDDKGKLACISRLTLAVVEGTPPPLVGSTRP